MKNDLYSKVMLTIIAAALVASDLRDEIAARLAGSSKPVLDVNIVGAASEIPVAIQKLDSNGMARPPLEVMIAGTAASLPVELSSQNSESNAKAPLDVRIVSSASDLPVAVQNFRSLQAQPVPVTLKGASEVLPVRILNEVLVAARESIRVRVENY